MVAITNGAIRSTKLRPATDGITCKRDMVLTEAFLQESIVGSETDDTSQ